MLPSSTVENYLKTIALHQQSGGEGLVPMGQVAAALGVAPGTATAMVKALAEAGLVQYEPYSGVRLTAAGEKLARRVLRRHRLIELFLVQVMGLKWDEVHDEAEQLEHVVSDRLVERMDEMLGRPEADPHGDPIPDAEGAIRDRELFSLLDCPLHRPVTITRVSDQDASFLRFIEHSNLKPGQSIEVEARDAMSDSVRVRGADEQRLTIGTRAASKLLVEVLPVLLCAVLACGATAAAQQPDAVPAPAAAPFEITDNSFFVEEAFNQEPKIVQNIFGVVRREGGAWAGAFTQEWPAPGQRHQLSYSLAFSHELGSGRFSDVGISYRYQLLSGEGGGIAFSPRISMLVRTDGKDGESYGEVGWQMNLPASKQLGEFFVHANAGLTVYPGVDTGFLPTGGVAPAPHVTLISPFVAGSVIARVRPMFHLMLESVLQYDERVAAPGITERDGFVTVAPGARLGWNLGDQQLVLGVAVPIVTGDDTTDTGLFGYASWELPFMR